MPISRSTLLRQLPPDQDEWITIVEDQNVDDIIIEVLDAHEEFEPYYDKLALYFNVGSVDEICRELADFCNENIKYREESKDNQTTALPSGILTRGYGDCKHYSLFCGGILAALQRMGKKIYWKYRFASYKADDMTPHHVFIVVFNKRGEEIIWIDPTPKASSLTPIYIKDGEPKTSDMALKRQIAGTAPDTDQRPVRATLGKASLTLTPLITGDNNLNFDGTHKYDRVFDPYLGLSMYRDYGGDRNLNSEQVADQLNAMIAAGPSPGHTIRPDFVEWVYNTNLRSFNFYYPRGVRPGFTAENILPANYPRLIMTPDGRLTLNSDVKLDDYRNAEIHLLTAWAQDLINKHDPTPYPIKPEAIKNHSQMKEGNIETRNLFSEARGDSIFKEIGKGLEKTLNFVKDGVIKIAGSIPRNAFLALVGINAFNFAGNLSDRINAGLWDEIAAKWKKIGGNPDKLRGTIEEGKNKKPILGQSNSIGEPITVGAFLTAAAPIIAVLVKFLDKDGKVTEVLSATKTFLQTNYPDIDLDAFGFLDRKTGKEIEWVVDDVDNENLGGGNNDLPKPNTSGPGALAWAKNNPIPSAAAVTLASYLIMNNGKQKKSFLVPVIIGGITYFFLSQSGSSSTPSASLTIPQKKAAIKNYVAKGGDSDESKRDWNEMVDTQFQDQEVSDIYDLFYTYDSKIDSLPAALKSRLQIISDKYNIFS